MAKFEQGYMGGFRGALGTAVGYQWNGKWVLRSRPAAVKNPRTEAQQTNRTLFAEEVRLAASMSWAINQTLTPTARQAGMTAYNLFVSLNQPAFGFDGQGLVVDYKSLLLSVGPVAPVEFTEMRMEEGSRLSVRFEKNMHLPQANRYDTVRLYLHSPAMGKGYLTAPVYRADKKVGVLIPSFLVGQELHVYGYVADAQGNFSQSVYVGTCTAEGEAVMAGGEVAETGAEGNPVSTAAAAAVPGLAAAKPTETRAHQQPG